MASKQRLVLSQLFVGYKKNMLQKLFCYFVTLPASRENSFDEKCAKFFSRARIPKRSQSVAAAVGVDDVVVVVVAVAAVVAFAAVAAVVAFAAVSVLWQFRTGFSC